MQIRTRGFTIVELLVVIVVVAVLASVTSVAFNGIQARARDNIRYQNVKDIMKLLEAYKIQNGSYPDDNYASSNANGCTNSDGWSYSWASSNGTWLRPLVDNGTTSSVPTPPSNSCTSYIRYTYHYSAADNCPSHPNDGYIIQVIRADGSFIPDETVTKGSTGDWKLCPEASIEWWVDGRTWVFYKDD